MMVAEATRASLVTNTGDGSAKCEQGKRFGEPVRALLLTKNAKFREFLMSEKRQKSGRQQAIRASRGHNGHATGLRRGPRCNPTAAPRQPRKAPIVYSSLLLCGSRERLLFINDYLSTSYKNSDFLIGKTSRF